MTKIKHVVDQAVTAPVNLGVTIEITAYNQQIQSSHVETPSRVFATPSTTW